MPKRAWTYLCYIKMMVNSISLFSVLQKIMHRQQSRMGHSILWCFLCSVWLFVCLHSPLLPFQTNERWLHQGWTMVLWGLWQFFDSWRKQNFTFLLSLRHFYFEINLRRSLECSLHRQGHLFWLPLYLKFWEWNIQKHLKQPVLRL